MPGIAGIITKAAVKESDVDQMIVSMVNEPFYKHGKYINRELGLLMGWVCHSGSFSDCMPVWNENKDICILFAGEEFNSSNEVEKLRSLGHRFTAQDASYLVHLYEEKGLEFIEKLNGWFSGLLVDLQRDMIVLFNDRYGLGRIYYCEKDDVLYFSSEAKSLLKVLPETRRLNFSCLAETFAYGCVLENKTLFSKIFLLPGGSRWIFQKNKSVFKDKYFNPSTFENLAPLNEKEYYEKLKETYTRILPNYLKGNQKVGISLTGGLDGRLIMAWSQGRTGSLPCYTFGGSYRDSFDVKIARKIAKMCKQPHQSIVVGGQFLKEFPELAEKAIFVSDGTMDVTGSVELFVNRLARDIAAVRLTGNYGSEILRGNIAFRPVRIDERFLQPEFARLVQRAGITYNAERQCHRQSFIAFKQVPWYHYSRLSVEQSQLTLRSPFLDNELVALTYRASPELLLSEKPSLRLIAEGNSRMAKIATDRGVAYRPIPILGHIRHAFQEFTVRTEYVYDYGMPQWMSKIDHILNRLQLEKIFLGRHKFYHFRIWYRDKLCEYIKEILLDNRTRQRPYLQGAFLEDMVNSHISGRRNYTLEIHKALTCELIQRKLIEQL